jgi:hypothetical protein
VFDDLKNTAQSVVAVVRMPVRNINILAPLTWMN